MGENTFKLSARKLASNFLYISMAAIIGSAIAYQARPLFHLYKVTSTPKPIFPINPTFFQEVNKIQINNPLGQFAMKKETHQNGSAWRLDGVNRLPAQETKVIDLLSAFSNISVENSYDLSVANAQNFLLDHPSTTIDVSDSKESFQIKIGMTKIEDNIAYLTISDQPIIYKVRFHEFPLRNLIPQRFVETKPFKYSLSNIDHLVLKKGRYSRVTLNLKKSDKEWLDSKNKTIAQARVHQLIKNFENIKVEAILDHIQDDDKELKKYISKRPMYEMTINSTQGKVDIAVYKIVKNIPKLKMKSRGYYLLSSSDRQTPMIIGKNSLQSFKIKESQLHELKVSNIIY